MRQGEPHDRVAHHGGLSGETWIILKSLDATMGLRVSNEDERMGLDQSQHSETGYTM